LKVEGGLRRRQEEEGEGDAADAGRKKGKENRESGFGGLL
jgi:hypothetical protein